MVNKYLTIFFLLIFSAAIHSQNTLLNVGDKAPVMLLVTADNGTQTFNFPYEGKIVLLHFWSSSVNKSKPFLARAIDLYDHYHSTTYRKAEGFEIVAIAVQSDKNAWKEDIASLKIEKLINCAAVKGFKDMYLQNYKLKQLPVTLLIDEDGSIININPTQLQIEEVLDAKKNPQKNIRDFNGKLMFTDGSTGPVKNQKLYLLNKFGDTLRQASTDIVGQFSFKAVKVLNELIIRVDTGGSALGKTKLCLANTQGACFDKIVKNFGTLDISLTPEEINTLDGYIENTDATKGNALSFTENISFKKGGAELETSAYEELNKLAAMLLKDKTYKLEIVSHTDSRGDDAANMELSKKRSAAIKNYLVTKEIAPNRIKPTGKGETELKNKCKNGVACTEVEHVENIRTEFKFYK